MFGRACNGAVSEGYQYIECCDECDCVFQEVLNKCFDDIEQFMVRLQNVADAYKELENRRKSRKKKGPHHGGTECFGHQALTLEFLFCSLNCCYVEYLDWIPNRHTVPIFYLKPTCLGTNQCQTVCLLLFSRLPMLSGPFRDCAIQGRPQADALDTCASKRISDKNFCGLS